MKIHNLIQGSPEWLAYRAQNFNASDAPARPTADAATDDFVADMTAAEGAAQ